MEPISLNNKVLILGGGLDQKLLVEAFQKRGFYTIIMDYYDNPPAKTVADKHYRESTYDKGKALEIARIEKVSYITTVSTDQPLLVAAYVAEKLGLKFHLTCEKALSITNKSYMKQIMQDHGIPTSPYIIITDIAETEKLKNIEYPAIMKPVDSSGSRGIFVVKNYNHAAKSIAHSFSVSATSMVIVEKFIPGLEISVDALVVSSKSRILMITDNYKMMNEYGTPLIYRSEYPSSISDKAKAHINDICQKICLAFQLDNTPFFLQAIIEGDKVSVIEFSARIAGGSKPYFIQRAIGINIVDVYVALLLDEPFDLSFGFLPGMLTVNYLYCHEGILQHIAGHKQLIREGLMDSLLEYRLPGSKIGGLANSSNRAGAFFISAFSREGIIEKTRIINPRLKVIDSKGTDLLHHDILNLKLEKQKDKGQINHREF